MGITKLIASFKYGHTGVFFNQKEINFHGLPFNLYAFNDGIYVQGTSKAYKKALGAKVLKINNVTIQEALERIKPVVNAENSQFFKAYGINYLRIPEILHAQKITKTLQHSVVLTLEKEGEIFTQSFTSLKEGAAVPTQHGYVHNDGDWLEARDQSAKPLYLSHFNKVYFSQYLAKEKALYVRHSSISDDATENTESFYARVFDTIRNSDVEKLVLDLRLNGGGNNFLNKSIITGILETKKINQIGKLYVILGRRTFSAAQNLVNELDNYTNVIFVGEPTAENINFWGDARPVKLPNSKIDVFLSYAWWQDKPSWINKEWTTPMLPVTMSFNEYATNKDPILEAALTFDSTDFKPKPMQYITDLYIAGKNELLVQELSKVIQSPRYAFCDFEKELNAAGLQLLSSRRSQEVQASIQVFILISNFFPNSAITFKNMGSAYLTIGDTQKAKEVLSKAISLDENGTVGKESQEILQKIN